MWLFNEILEKKKSQNPQHHYIVVVSHSGNADSFMVAAILLSISQTHTCICELLISFLTQRLTFSNAMEMPYFSCLRET